MLQWAMVFHIIGIVFWVGGLLVITHLLAQHTQEESPPAREALARAESKVLRGLAHPGAAIVLITGGIMIQTKPQYYLHAHWLRAKLALVLAIIILDLIITFRVRAFAAGRRQITRGTCMAWHGALALVFTLILVLVILKPF
jgi:protoporphyrinogen IX oxidase